MNSGAVLPTVDLLDMHLACVDREQLLDHLFSELGQARGGWLITANLDFLRRHVRDAQLRRLYEAADLRVADGMPLVWAARLQGQPLPERIAGSELMEPLAERAAAAGRSIYLLGGAPGAAPMAAQILQERHARLRIAGHSAPMVSDPPTEEQLAPLLIELERCRPDILLVGLGSPKQERLIERLRERFPAMWMIGVGVTFSFVAGHVRQAPPWMRRFSLEWVHRLAQEPGRLGRRYVVDGLPFAAELFGRVIARRVASRFGL